MIFITKKIKLEDFAKVWSLETGFLPSGDCHFEMTKKPNVKKPISSDLQYSIFSLNSHIYCNKLRLI